MIKRKLSSIAYNSLMGFQRETAGLPNRLFNESAFCDLPGTQEGPAAGCRVTGLGWRLGWRTERMEVPAAVGGCAVNSNYR